MSLELFNKKNYHRKVIISICLIGIMLFFIITNIIWLAIDTLPPYYDPLNHMARARLLSVDLKNIDRIKKLYSPFFYLTTIPFLKLVGVNDDSFAYVNSLYIIILIMSVFGIAKILFDEWSGVGSAFLVLLYPFVFYMTRQYYLDFALLAVVSLVQYLILKSEGGTRKYWNIGLGIAAGCALLIKPHGALFFLPTWIISFLYHHNKKGKLKPVLLALAIILIIALPWYIIARKDFIRWNIKIYKAQTIALPQNKNLFTVLSIYNSLLYEHMVLPYLFFAFLIGLASYIIFDRRWKMLLILLSLIVVPLIALALWPNKDPRFILPVLPVFAILTIGGASRIPSKLFKTMSWSAIFFVALLQFVHFSFTPICFFKNDASVYCTPARPSRVNWKIKEILDYLSDYSGAKKVSIGIITMDQPHFNDGLFKYYTSCSGFSFKFQDRKIIENYGNLKEARLIKNTLSQCDLVITRKPQDGHEYAELLCKEFNEVEADRFGFKMIREFELPDASKAIIYENTQKRSVKLENNR